MLEKSKKKFFASAAIGSVVVLFPGTALAQSEAPIDEIIVTANKRDENLSRVGASIAAFDNTMLENRNIGSAEELAQTVPSMTLVASTHGTPVFTLRGIGFNADSLGVYPAVSVSIDQAPMAFPVLAARSMYDLERVEVLKGPQGTLFGQNSTGGAINYVVAKPTSELDAGFNLSYGRFNEVRGTAYLSGPIDDRLGMRLAIDAGHRDDWQYNYTRKDSIGEQNYIAARLVTVWEPTDSLKFELNVNGSVDRSEPSALQMIASLPSNPAAPTFAELNAPLAPRNLRAANWSNAGRAGNAFQSATDPSRPEGNRKQFQTFLRADLDVTDDISLTSITTYNRLKQDMVFDLDGSEYEMINNPRDTGTISDFSQELRVSNAASGSPFRWTLGVNYNHSRVYQFQAIAYGDNSLSNAGTNFIHITDVENTGVMNNYAAFASGEYDVGDQFTLKAAVRYSKSINRNTACDQDNAGDQNLNELFTLLGQLLGGQTVPLAPGQCYPLNANNLPGDPYLGRLSEDNVSWKVGVDFKPSSVTLLYANVSRGYKAGSFPVITASLQEQLFPAQQESVTSYEAGLKTRLLDNKVQFSSAIFYQDYRNKQIQGTVNTLLFGLLQRLDNVPKSRIFGFEAETVIRPINGLTLTGSASYLDSKVNRYTGVSVFGDVTDFSGNPLPFAPKWTLVGDIDYRTQLANGGTVFLGGGVNYRTSADTYIGGSVLQIPDNGVNRWVSRIPFKIDGYALVDTRIGYEFPGEKITLSLWGKNIFNQFHVENVISYNDVIARAVGQPASYGVTLKVRWK